MAVWAIVDGERMPAARACIPVSDPAVTLGWSVFETLVWPCPDLTRHIDRLTASATAALVPMPATSILEAEIRAAVAGIDGEARVRVTLTGGGRRFVVAEPLDPSRRHRPVTAVRGEHRDEPVLGGAVKHGSRLPWVVAQRRSGADEVLLVDSDGRFTEGTTSAILAVVGGVVQTAPHDGRILESTTLLAILERAASAGIEVERIGPRADGGWDALYVASATRDIAPVISLDGVALPGWDPVGRALASLRSGGAGPG